jgi:hypothetical protein
LDRMQMNIFQGERNTGFKISLCQSSNLQE